MFDSTTSVFISARSSTKPPGGEWPGTKPSVALLVDHDLDEEIHVGDEVALAEIVFAQLDQEVVARVAMPVVAQLLVATFAELGAPCAAVPCPVIVSCQPTCLA